MRWNGWFLSIKLSVKHIKEYIRNGSVFWYNIRLNEKLDYPLSD